MTEILFNTTEGSQPQFKKLQSLKRKGWSVLDADSTGGVAGGLRLVLGNTSRAFGASGSIAAMPTRGQALRILCVHGVNHLESDPGGPMTPAEQNWRTAIASASAQWGLAAELRFATYNELFDTAKLTPFFLARSVARLGASGIWHEIGDLFGARGFGPQGGLGDTLEWTAGMVCEWAGNDKLRGQLRRRLLQEIADFRPDLLLAHSLGTLVIYDTLARLENTSAPGVAGLTLATFGSQIGHPTVREVFGGRIVPIKPLRHWYHLYNKYDHVFTAPLDVRFGSKEPSNFSQHNTTFDIPGDILNHDCARYLTHPDAISALWRDAATEAGAVGRNLVGFPKLISQQTRAGKLRATTVRHGKPSKRALLVGISEYADPANSLAGCTNDVFLMSRLLQEADFEAKNIRIVLDRRATATAIRERLEWLLDGALDGQDRVFYYAGHGAQIPGYGVGETIDRLDECLVPYDFDWSRERAVVDDQFYELYSQLPENTRFLTIFDCCHSGGMTREGGVRARGLALPDDIRHRILEWKDKTFVERKIDDKAITPLQAEGKSPDYRHGPLRRLGCAAGLRGDDARKFKANRAKFGHEGPFMPFLLQACAEGELAYEYRHGSQSNGAFTWFLGEVLHQTGGKLNWEGFVGRIGDLIEAQGYQQHPQLLCPTNLRRNTIPWHKTNNK